MTLFAGIAAAFFTYRNVQAMAANVPPPRVPANLDVLKVIPGVWGWKFDFMQSCTENPQTITVSSNRQRVAVRYAKPIWNGSKSVDLIEFEVVTTSPDTLVLGVPAQGGATSRARVTLRFDDADNYDLKRSDMALPMAVVRCPP
ncbi:MAG: hypothetical protein WDN25_16785 [Acetobacteraceae bacterium]